MLWLVELDGPEAIDGVDAGLLEDDGDVSCCGCNVTAMVTELAYGEEGMFGKGREEMRFASS